MLGLGCAYLLGDALSSLLVIQAQLWRMVWLVAVLAAVTLAPTVLALWREDEHGRVTVLLLLAGWSFLDQPIVASVCAVSALTMSLVARPRRLHIGDRAVALIAVALCALVAVQVCARIVAIGLAASAAPDHQALRLLLKLHVLAVPVAAAAISFALLRARRPGRWAPAATLGALVPCIAAAWLWDGRSPIQRTMENAGGNTGLVARVAPSPGPVIWLDGIEETTLWMRRPNWYSTLQGSSIVFSRPLALEWARRRGEASRFGLVPPDDADLPTDVATRPLPTLTGGQIAAACADLTGLAWIVLPVLPGAPDPSGVAAIDWTPPAPVTRMSVSEHVEWTRIDHYALVNCRSVRTR